MTIIDMIFELGRLSEINGACFESRNFAAQVATLSEMQEIADNLAAQTNELRDGIHRNLVTAQICLDHVNKAK